MTRDAMRRLTLALFATIGIARGQEQEWTTITRAKDKQSIEVSIQSVKDGQVSFSMKDGKSYTIDLATLTEKDQAKLKTWKPKRVSPAIANAKVTAAGLEEESHRYQCKNFLFLTEKEVAPEDLQPLSLALETILMSFAALPVEIQPKPGGPRFRVKLFDGEAEFSLDNGGDLPEGEAAVYNPIQDALLAPKLRLEPGSRLTAEAVYLMIGKQVETIPPWLTVGLAEYVAAAPMKAGEASFANPVEAALRHIEKDFGGKDRAFIMAAPERVLDFSYGDFREGDVEVKNKNRASALLLVAYLAHLEDKGGGRALKDFLLNSRTGPKEDAVAALMRKRTASKFADEMKVAYLAKGLKLTFD